MAADADDVVGGGRCCSGAVAGGWPPRNSREGLSMRVQVKKSFPPYLDLCSKATQPL